LYRAAQPAIGKGPDLPSVGESIRSTARDVADPYGAVERFRERPLSEQLLAGMIYDPTNIVGGDLVVPTLIATPPAGSAAETAVTGGDTAVAGTAYNCEWIILVATDDSQAYFDRIAQTKVSFDVGLRQGFNTATVYNYEGNKAFEGTGVGRHWGLAYDESDALRKYDTSQLPGAYSIQYPSPVDSTATYDSYTITHGLPAVTTQGTVSLNPFETIVSISPSDVLFISTQYFAPLFSGAVAGQTGQAAPPLKIK